MAAPSHDDRLAAALRVVGIDTRRAADNIRKGLIAAIRHALHAESVAFLGYAEGGHGEIFCTGVHRVGSRAATALDLEGHLAPFGADVIRRPVAGTPNRFVQFEVVAGLPRPVVGTFYAGDEVLGSVVVNVGGHSAGRDVMRALNGSASRVAAALRRAADLDDEMWLAGSPVAAVIGADGTVTESTSPAARHFVGRRGERLRERICETIRAGGSRRFTYAGGWARVEPLLGAGPRSAYIVVLSQVERPRLAADHALTPRQREVCTLYARGMRPSRIAPRLGLTARSVQRLLKQCFERLGVSDRATLRALLDTAPAPVKRARTRSSQLTGRAVQLERARWGLLRASAERP